MSAKKRKNKGRLLPFIKFHRWVGLLSCIVIVVVSITGIMLNHTQEMKLDERFITNTWLYDWYEIKLPEQQGFVQLGTNSLVQIGTRVYFDHTRLPDESSVLIGGYKTEQLLFVSMQEAVYLLTYEGELIEKLSSENTLPTPVTDIALSEDKKYVFIGSGKNWYHSNDGYLTWNKLESPPSVYPYKKTSNLPLDMAYYRDAWLGNELSLERVVLDLHSGRLLGRWGIYFMDIMAMFLIALAISGLWIWSRRYKKK